MKIVKNKCMYVSGLGRIWIENVDFLCMYPSSATKSGSLTPRKTSWYIVSAQVRHPGMMEDDMYKLRKRSYFFHLLLRLLSLKLGALS